MQDKKNTTPRRGMPKAQMALEARRLVELGRTRKYIAQHFGVSERYIYKLLTEVDEQGDFIIHRAPDFIRYDKLPKDVQKSIEFSADGFERFFNKYSGFELTPLHKDWVHQAINAERLLINVPPRHAKSEIFSVWFVVWLIAGAEACRISPEDPDAHGLRNVQIILISETEKLAKKFANKIAFQLTSNQLLIEDFGRFKPEAGDWPWRPNSGELMVDGRDRDVESGDLTLQCRGASQQILGMEADWEIVDDPVSRETARSEAEREKLSEWFHGDVLTRLEPNARAIVVGQRLHMHDLYGELAAEKTILDGNEHSWTHINYKAIQDWDAQTVLWPEKWSFERLMQTYQDIGEDLFEAMYQQNPLAVGRRLVRPEWLYGSEEYTGCVDYLRAPGPTNFPRGEDTVRVVSLDPSPTRFAGLIVADVKPDNSGFNATILEVTREKMSVRDMIQHLDRCIAMYEPDYFIFEQAAAQRWFLQDKEMDRIRQQVRVIPHNTGRNKGDPALGIESLATDFEFGRIRFPYGDAEGKYMSEMLFDEARQYPQGRTDDLLMALWFIKFNYMRLVPQGVLERSRERWQQNIPPRLQNGWGWWQKAREQRIR